MKILKFKTNIKTKPGVATISNFIDRWDEVVNWEVETTSADSILTVRGNVRESKVLSAFRKAGLQIARVG